MSDLMYYEKPVLLDRARHRQRRIRASAGFAFARKANSLYLAAAEFAEACKEYAIVFTRGSSGVIPVAMLGLRPRENLYIAPDASWQGRYIPAFVRRYPFVLAALPGQGMAVCIDEAFEGVNETEGDALFDAQGNDTPYLRNALDFLTACQREHVRTDAFCKRLDEAGLLTAMNARADLVDGRSFSIQGLLVVDEKKLLALPDATVLAMFRAGELNLVAMHLLSLSNMQQLVDRLAQRKVPPAPAAPAP
jgi:hypothetical protein